MGVEADTAEIPQEDEQWMDRALEMAERALSENEVPVGAVLVLDGELIGTGWNQPIGRCDPSAHAEIVALRDAGKRLNNYRLVGSTLYVTLEPCVMCMGAIVQARVKRVVFGASDPQRGAIVGPINLAEAPFLNHRVEFSGGVREETCRSQLKGFFRDRR